MPGRHVLVERLDGSGSRQLPILLVHVVRTAPRVVPDPDAEVLDLEGLLLVDLMHSQSSIPPAPVLVHIPC